MRIRWKWCRLAEGGGGYWTLPSIPIWAMETSIWFKVHMWCMKHSSTPSVELLKVDISSFTLHTIGTYHSQTTIGVYDLFLTTLVHDNLSDVDALVLLRVKEARDTWTYSYDERHASLQGGSWPEHHSDVEVLAHAPVPLTQASWRWTVGSLSSSSSPSEAWQLKKNGWW